MNLKKPLPDQAAESLTVWRGKVKLSKRVHWVHTERVRVLPVLLFFKVEIDGVIFSPLRA